MSAMEDKIESSVRKNKTMQHEDTLFLECTYMIQESAFAIQKYF